MLILSEKAHKAIRLSEKKNVISHLLVVLTQRHAYSRWQKAPKKISCSDANSGCCGLTRLLYIISTSKFSNVSLNQLASFLCLRQRSNQNSNCQPQDGPW